jgi:flagellar hook-length control protein FliK
MAYDNPASFISAPSGSLLALAQQAIRQVPNDDHSTEFLAALAAQFKAINPAPSDEGTAQPQWSPTAGEVPSSPLTLQDFVRYLKDIGISPPIPADEETATSTDPTPISPSDDILPDQSSLPDERFPQDGSPAEIWEMIAAFFRPPSPEKVEQTDDQAGENKAELVQQQRIFAAAHEASHARLSLPNDDHRTTVETDFLSELAASNSLPQTESRETPKREMTGLSATTPHQLGMVPLNQSPEWPALSNIQTFNEEYPPTTPEVSINEQSRMQPMRSSAHALKTGGAESQTKAVSENNSNPLSRLKWLHQKSDNRSVSPWLAADAELLASSQNALNSPEVNGRLIEPENQVFLNTNPATMAGVHVEPNSPAQGSTELKSPQGEATANILPTTTLDSALVTTQVKSTDATTFSTPFPANEHQVSSDVIGQNADHSTSLQFSSEDHALDPSTTMLNQAERKVARRPQGNSLSAPMLHDHAAAESSQQTANSNFTPGQILPSIGTSQAERSVKTSHRETTLSSSAVGRKNTYSLSSPPEQLVQDQNMGATPILPGGNESLVRQEEMNGISSPSPIASGFTPSDKRTMSSVLPEEQRRQEDFRSQDQKMSFTTQAHQTPKFAPDQEEESTSLPQNKSLPNIDTQVPSASEPRSTPLEELTVPRRESAPSNTAAHDKSVPDFQPGTKQIKTAAPVTERASSTTNVSAKTPVPSTTDFAFASVEKSASTPQEPFLPNMASLTPSPSPASMEESAFVPGKSFLSNTASVTEQTSSTTKVSTKTPVPLTTGPDPASLEEPVSTQREASPSNAAVNSKFVPEIQPHTTPTNTPAHSTARSNSEVVDERASTQPSLLNDEGSAPSIMKSSIQQNASSAPTIERNETVPEMTSSPAQSKETRLATLSKETSVPQITTGQSVPPANHWSSTSQTHLKASSPSSHSLGTKGFAATPALEAATEVDLPESDAMAESLSNSRDGRIIAAKAQEKSSLIADEPLLPSSQANTPDQPTEPKAPTNRVNQTSIPQASGSSSHTEVDAIEKSVGQTGWSDELGGRVERMLDKSVHSAEIKLNPAHLGPLEVRIRLHQDQAEIQFSSQHAAVREAIETALPKLREMLGHQQINLVDSSVVVPSNQTASDGTGQFSNFDRQPRFGYSGSSAAEAVVEHDEIVTTEPGRPAVDNGLISFYA